MPNKITNSRFSITHNENEYYELRLLADIELGIQDVKDIIEIQKQLGGKRMPTLVVGTNYSNTSLDAMKYVSSNENFPYSSAGAYVISSLAQRMMANFYLHFNKPQRPTKFFNSEEEAVEWILSLIKKKEN